MSSATKIPLVFDHRRSDDGRLLIMAIFKVVGQSTKMVPVGKETTAHREPFRFLAEICRWAYLDGVWATREPTDNFCSAGPQIVQVSSEG